MDALKVRPRRHLFELAKLALHGLRQMGKFGYFSDGGHSATAKGANQAALFTQACRGRGKVGGEITVDARRRDAQVSG